MTWDNNKSTASDPDNPNADEQLTADEWDNHVTDQKNHAARHESGGSDALSLLASQISDFTSSVINAIQGSSIAPNSVDTNALEATTLLIGGKLFEEDANSPFNASGSSDTFTVGNDYNEIIIVPIRDGSVGYDNMQVNGDTGSNYRYVNNDGTKTTGATSFDIPRSNSTSFYHVFDSGPRVNISIEFANGANEPVGGNNDNLGDNGINSITLSDSLGSIRESNLRIYGRSL